MLRFITSRVAHSVLVVWGAYTLSFWLLIALPSNALMIKIAGAIPLNQIPPAQLAKLKEQYGLNHSAMVEYAIHLGNALRGDLGTSLNTGQPVTSVIWAVLPSTLELTGVAVVIGVLFGLALGTLAAYSSSAALREAVLAVSPSGNSIPTFAVGLVLINVFAFTFRIFPSGGTTGFVSIILPAITLALPIVAVVTQIFAKSLMRVLGDDYIRTAVAKGARWSRIYFYHALRNSVSPTLTLAGVIAGNLLAGTVVVETVFSRPGIGATAVNAVDTQDLPVLQGVVLLSATFFVVINLLVDLLLPVIDPRLVPAGRRSAMAAEARTEIEEEVAAQ